MTRTVHVVVRGVTRVSSVEFDEGMRSLARDGKRLGIVFSLRIDYDFGRVACLVCGQHDTEEQRACFMRFFEVLRMEFRPGERYIEVIEDSHWPPTSGRSQQSSGGGEKDGVELFAEGVSGWELAGETR